VADCGRGSAREAWLAAVEWRRQAEERQGTWPAPTEARQCPRILSGGVRASPPALSKCGRRGFWARCLNWCTTGGPKNVPARPRAQINSRRSHAGPCTAGPYRERRQLAVRWKKSPRAHVPSKINPKKSPITPPPTLRSSRRQRRRTPF
jgi:hypothetical protein